MFEDKSSVKLFNITLNTIKSPSSLNGLKSISYIKKIRGKESKIHFKNLLI